MTFRTGSLTDVLNDEHYRGRLQLFNNISPGNLSLFISDLREEDQGVYRCRTEKKHRDFRIYVKGCELVKKAEVEDMTVFTGESVVLPCVCTDLQNKPKSLKWEFSIPTESNSNHYQEIYPEQTGHHRNRVKLVSKNSPGNLSLLLSDLTEEDQGNYRCSVQAERKDFRLNVKVGRRETSTHSGKTDRRPPSEQPPSKTTNSPPSSSSTTLEQDKQQIHSRPLVFGIAAAFLLVVIGVVAFICWRRKGGRSGKKVITEGHPKQKDQTVPDVTYSTVSHIHTAGAARVQINAGEKTEYASIVTN
ncbi:junctional adhesion molecule-like [Hemibagrus wyckioides]|uniref:junctional adhesion molecule-like n=1 Tax=Hemibagrus wyckioides TaxID=337641 RepID=UPI00266BC610|nr:junctional adhesion molecule-like [Hemibagrus wyckioides]